MEVLSELTHILADPAHWVAEVVMDVTIWAVAWVVGGRMAVKRAVRKHDRKVHNA
jgi:hypothetical protein